MYGEMKLALFIYLWYPKTKGTTNVYETVLRPYVSKHEYDFDKMFREWGVRGWDLAIYYWKNCTELGQATLWQFLDYLAAQSKKISSKNSSKKKDGKDPYAPSAPPLPDIRSALFDNYESNFSGRKK